MAWVKRYFPLMIGVMAVLLLWVWMSMQQQEARSLQTNLQTQVNALTTQQSQQTAQIDQLKIQISDSAQAWVLSEVYYYLNVAHLRLFVFNDVKTALQLMQWAQHRLTAAHAPIGLQEALLSDIAELSTVQLPDVNAITQTLSYVQTQLPQLKAHQPFQTEEEVVPSVPQEAANWRDALKSAWHDLKNLIRVQPRGAHTDYALFDETILRQTVMVALQRASIAAVIGQNDLYQASLSQAIALLQQFFAPDLELQHLIETLQQLLQQPIVPHLPEANRALIWLQMQTGEGRA
ncbi:MAG TPA: uroporphyrinogen-III C-methyltransferase [Gammaproteobacteria bacterium]|nr:uroporphyrinogen-III C-methyltransferase [Gammaproteobacteria bacterium]